LLNAFRFCGYGCDQPTANVKSVAWLPIAPSIVPLRDDLGCR
jgi:hypothetical protein